MNILVHQDLAALVDQWLESENNGDRFPVPFDVAWQIAGYSRKDSAKRYLPKASQGELFHRNVEKTGGRPRETIMLSCDGLKHLCLMADTSQGHQIRQYFIDAEKKWRLVEKHRPEVASEIEILKLQAEISRNQRFIMERSEVIMNLHGKQVLALIQGRPDAVIHEETVVTEVVDPDKGTSTKILTAEQLRRAIKDRTGQDVKTMKSFTDALRKAGRDDLLIPVKRLAPVTEYVKPDRLDEAIAVVFGNRRQSLLGE